MKYFTIIALPTVLFGLVGSYALPISRLRNRQELNLELCANPEAVLDPGCWDLINIPDYLNNPNTGWNHTIPICADSTKCCTDDDTGWSTCFLRLAQKGAGEDCTTTSDEHCQSGKTLAPDLHPDIVASVRVTVESIYGVQGFFRTYYQSKSLSADGKYGFTDSQRLARRFPPSVIHNSQHHRIFRSQKRITDHDFCRIGCPVCWACVSYGISISCLLIQALMLIDLV